MKVTILNHTSSRERKFYCLIITKTPGRQVYHVLNKNYNVYKKRQGGNNVIIKVVPKKTLTKRKNNV